MASLKYYNKITNQWEYVNFGSESGSSDILIDNSLTQAGQAADAKAVGDALAEKQPKGDYLTEHQSLAEYVKTVDLGALATKDSLTAAEVGALAADTLPTAINTALAQAKASGEFDGRTPVKGTDYYTEADKAEMVSAVIAALPVYNGEVV